MEEETKTKGRSVTFKKRLSLLRSTPSYLKKKKGGGAGRVERPEIKG